MMSLPSYRWVACFGACTLACLPKDTRPPPASVLVTVTANDALLTGIPSTSTEDGWSIFYDRFLVSFGRPSLDGSGCNNGYSEGYSRILDMKTPGPQKLNLLFALGECDFSFRISAPSPDSVLGLGVTDEDKILLGTFGLDDSEAGPRPISIYVQGSATKDNVTKTFAWSFRRRIDYRTCAVDVGDARVEGLVLESNDSDTVDISVHGEAFFQDNVDVAKAKLRFAAFADADTQFGNNDGEITLDEIGLVPLTAIGSTNNYYVDADGGIGSWTTLEDYVDSGVLSNVARFRSNGTCVPMVTNPSPRRGARGFE
jgi:hypothetical protein